ncbi:LysR family transcriptional regulator, partial [Loktanella sp. DJP18]|uniref:LysR family transcriptional regulator n=1 Tax=Loktanella sp. DJP18 TaxID=3409788 RepID=UPI003BB4DAA8
MTGAGLRHLRVLLAVAESGSVTEAAQASGVSQPAVTQALHKLESIAGGPLFDRTHRGTFATPRGAVLIRRVRRALGRLDPALTA